MAGFCKPGRNVLCCWRLLEIRNVNDGVANPIRIVEVNTSYEVKQQSGEETSLEREIENINVSRTLNFVFRQMNQEFITLLHLVDVRVGFFRLYQENGKETHAYQEVALPDLDTLLAQAIVPKKRTEVQNAIIRQFAHIFDYEEKTLHNARLAFEVEKLKLAKTIIENKDEEAAKLYEMLFKPTSVAAKEAPAQGSVTAIPSMGSHVLQELTSV